MPVAETVSAKNKDLSEALEDL